MTQHSYPFGDDLVLFSNGNFQASKDDSGKWSFGFGDEYEFDLASLIEFINFLEAAGVLSMESPTFSNVDDPTISP